MAKNRKDNIDSFSGMFRGITSEQNQIKTKEHISSIDSEKYMPDPVEQIKEKQITREPRKRGRPKLNRETKKRISFTILPSLYEQASEIAYNEGKSVSELIAEFLTEYVKKHK